MGGTFWNSNELCVQQAIPTSGELSNLYIRLAGVVPGGQSYTFTVMKNGNPTSLSAAIAAGGYQGSDTDPSHAVPFVAGDRVSLRCIHVGAETTNRAMWTSLWTGSVARESICLLTVNCNSISTLYDHIAGGTDAEADPNEKYVRVPMPTSGTLKSLYISLSENPGTDPDAYSFTLRKNSADTALTCTIVAPNTTGNDIAHSVPVVAGNMMSFSIVPLNDPSAQPWAAIGMVFLADIDGESLIFGGCTDAPGIGVTEYYYLQSGANARPWAAAESDRFQLIQNCLLKKFYVLLNSPTTRDGLTVTLRFEAADAGNPNPISVTLSAIETLKSDLINTFSPSNPPAARIDMKCAVPAGSNVVRVRTGIVCSFAEAISSKSGGIASKLAAIGVV